MTERAVITTAASTLLWVQAGGRCEYRGCNRYLLADELTGFELNLADRAHIVGATTATGSPRGDAALPVDRRGEPENLMLLCRDHHRVIDRLIAEHGVGELRRMKSEHEERIRLLTGLHEEASTVVVRAIGAIRRAPVHIPPEAILPAVIADGRFPRFPLALAGEDVEIDLRTLPEDELSSWAAGERIVAVQMARIRDAQAHVNHVSLFALARIPLLVAIGYHLDDKIPTAIYGRRRSGTGDGAWGFAADAPTISFDLRRLRGTGTEAEVSLAVSLTAPIGKDVVAGCPSLSAVYELAPEGGAHGRDVLDARASLDRFADAYHRFLAHVEAHHPECRTLDLYAAAPAPAAVQLGRGVMRDAQPALRVHDRDRGGTFRGALTLPAADA